MKCNKTYWQNKEIIELPRSVITARNISDGAKNTLAFLLNYSDRDEIAISQGRIAEELGKSPATINRHYLQLEDEGYIILIRKPGYSHKVLFTSKSLPSVTGSDDLGVKKTIFKYLQE